MPKFSVIIPVYNGEETIERAINSITNSTFYDLEIIVVDNCSNDRTREIVLRMQTNDSRLLYHYTDIKGQSNARNEGIQLAVGEYLIFPDADDEIDCYLLEKLNKMTIENDYDIIVYTICVKMESLMIRLEIKQVSESEDIVPYIMNANLFHGANNKCYKRSFLIDNALYFENNLIAIEDVVFNCKVFKETRKIGYTSEGVYYLHRSSKETASTKYIDMKVNYLDRELKNIIELGNYLNLSDNSVYQEFLRKKCFYQSEEIVFNYFRKMCPLTKKQIIFGIERNVFMNESRYKLSIEAVVEGLFNKFFRTMLVIRNSRVMFQVMKILSFLRNRFSSQMLRISFRINNK